MVGHKKPKDKYRLRLWIQLYTITRSIETEIRNRLRQEFKETLPRFDVMAALHRKPDGMIMTELSRFLMVSNGNVTGIVERLVKDELVRRYQREGNRRSWYISLTQKGNESFELMAIAHEKWISELLQNFDENTTERLHEDLSLLKNFKGTQ